MDQVTGVELAFLALWLLPPVIAWARRHRSLAAIAVLGYGLGWIPLVGFVALIWSLTGNVRELRPSSK